VSIAHVQFDLQAKLPVRPTACTYTIAAIVILQYIGLFHQDPEVRASHHIFHGILVQVSMPLAFEGLCTSLLHCS
jgi:hypothetical protein